MALGALVLVVVGGATVGLVVGGDDEPVVSNQQAGTGATSGDGSASAGPRPTETGELTPAQAEAHRGLFGAIDAAERTMIELNEALPPSATGSDASELGRISDTAGARAGELRAVRDDLTTLDSADSVAVVAIRDTYLDHLDAWIDWAEAVAQDPTVLDRPEEAAAFFDAINFTAEDFTDAVDVNLDEDRVPADVADLAESIIERGFRNSGEDGTEV